MKIATVFLLITDRHLAEQMHDDDIIKCMPFLECIRISALNIYFNFHVIIHFRSILATRLVSFAR